MLTRQHELSGPSWGPAPTAWGGVGLAARPGTAPARAGSDVDTAGEEVLVDDLSDLEEEFLDPIEVPDAGAEKATAQRRGRTQRRLSALRRWRPAILLAGLVAGALIGTAIGVPAGLGGGPTVPSGGDYVLGLEQTGRGNGTDVARSRGEISEAEAQARLNQIAASRAAREPKFVRPVDGVMTTCYCMRWGVMHTGVDLAAPLGTPIFAVSDGVVLRAGPASGFGYAVWIKDADGNVQVYGHMRYFYVTAGQVVAAGDKIAAVGNEGESTGPHLHYELRRGSMSGPTLNVEKWLAARGITY